MRKSFLFILFLSLPAFLYSQKSLEAYKLFTETGKKARYDKMLDDLKSADVVFIGEFHDNPISHWLQLEITREIGNARPVILGAEMFEADNQEALNNYLSEDIDAKALDSTARLWTNFKTDYKPLVDYARENNLDFIATNIPRRYANKVYKEGFEGLNELSVSEKEWIAPLPMNYDADLPSYKNMLTMMGDHGSPTMPMAQASKDATMAWFIAENLKEGSVFIHYNGSYHSDYKEGIIWHLNQYKPGLRIVTLTTVKQNDLSGLEADHKGKADYIIAVDEDMTSTYR